MFRILHKRRRLFSTIILFTFFLFMGGLTAVLEDAHSSGGEAVEHGSPDRDHGDKNSEDRSGDLLDLLWRIINFALLVIILFIVIKKSPLKGLFATRSEEIRRKLEDLKKEKEEAENRYMEIERQLKDFETEKKDIIDQYKREGLAEKDRIIIEAKDRVKQIIDQSELTIRQEIQSARERLKRDVIELAARQAEEIIKKEIDETDQAKLINEFIERVGKIH